MEAQTRTIERDHPAEYNDECDSWDEKSVIGERTGREWTYFYDGNIPMDGICIVREAMEDPSEWQ